MLLCLLGLTLASPPAHIEYVNASSQLGARSGSWLHGATALFDGNDSTAWCGGESPARPGRIAVEFDRPIRADRIRIVVGNSIRFGGFGPMNRPRVLTLTNMKYVWQVILPDDPKPFELPLPPPITGRQLVLQVEGVHDHGGRHTCIAELTLFEGKKPIRLRRHVAQRGMPSLEGVWARADAVTPEDFLVFYRDGRFRQRHHPDSGKPPPDKVGTWRWRKGGRLELKLGGTIQLGKAKISPQADGRNLLTLDGAYAGPWLPHVPETGYESDIH